MQTTCNNKYSMLLYRCKQLAYMRIAIVGKGGSGKSSLSWLFSRFLSEQGYSTLAIDADYNMDLAHNLQVNLQDYTLLKTAEADIYKHFNLNLSQNIFDAIKNTTVEMFQWNDSFMQKYAQRINNNLSLMILGDHDNETLYSGRCSHAYAKAIKFYLPYLKVEPQQVVLIDSVAGTDMLNYGLYLGVDLIICAVEDTKNSVGVMHSTQKIAQELNIPFIAVQNKTLQNATAHIAEATAAQFTFDPALASYSYKEVNPENEQQCHKLFSHIFSTYKVQNTVTRLERWKNIHDSHHTH